MSLIDQQAITEKTFVTELVNNPSLVRIAERLSIASNDILGARHREIFEAILRLSESLESVSTVDLHMELFSSHGQYMASLIRVDDRSPNFEFVCRQLKKLSRAVVTFDKIESLKSGVLKSSENLSTEITRSISEIEALASDYANLTSLDVSDLKEAKVEYINASLQQIKTYATKLTSLDQYLQGGFVPTRNYVVAARPGHGKTTFATTVFDSLVAQDVRCLYITREMPKHEILAKLMAKRFDKEFSLVANPGGLGSYERSNAREFAKRYQDSGGYIVDNTGSDYAKARSIIKTAAIDHSVEVVFLDYIGLFYWPDKKPATRREEINLIATDMKMLALDYNIAVVGLSQLNRQSEGDERKFIMMTDMKESGGIEENADCIIGLKNDPVNVHKSHLTIVKNRFGPTGIVPVWRDFQHSQFKNWDINLEIKEDAEQKPSDFIRPHGSGSEDQSDTFRDKSSKRIYRNCRG